MVISPGRGYAERDAGVAADVIADGDECVLDQ